MVLPSLNRSDALSTTGWRRKACEARQIASGRQHANCPEPTPMRWNEHTLRRAETVIAIVVIALLILAYLVSKVR